jgi:hypothetical protein
MKKRLGFVSNSSSSSFWFTGKMINDVNSITDKDILNDTYYFFGKELGEAQDIMSIATWEDLLVIKHIFNKDVEDVDYKIGIEDNKNDNTLQFQKDYKSNTNYIELCETYFEYDYDGVLNKIKQKLLNKKIKKIKK